MRRVSKKQAARNRKARNLYNKLLEEVGRCEVCGHDPSQPRCWCGSMYISWAMELHHLIRGLRPNERCAVLLVCWRCHHTKLAEPAKWPEARQLAALKRSRPGDYNLDKYSKLAGRGPERITDEDVAKFVLVSAVD